MVTVSSLPIWQAGSEQFYRPCGLVESKLLPMAIEMLTDKVPNLVPNLILQDGPCPACKCSPRRHALFSTGAQSRTPGGKGPRPGGRVYHILRRFTRDSLVTNPPRAYCPRPGGRVAHLCQGEGADQDGAACEAARSAHRRYGERPGRGGGDRDGARGARGGACFRSEAQHASAHHGAPLSSPQVRASDPKLEAALTYLEETHSLSLKKEDAKAEAPS